MYPKYIEFMATQISVEVARPQNALYLIFVDLEFSKKDLYLLFLEGNILWSHKWPKSANTHIFFSFSRYIY